MEIELIFYTQIASIVGYILAVFTLYRLLVSQKDSVIELLKQRNNLLEDKIKELEAQSPDVLVNSLSQRVEIAKLEITRLREDGEDHKGQISEKEAKLGILSKRLDQLNSLLEDNDLLCPHCQAPLSRREFHSIFGECNGREIEVDIECAEYECGYAVREDRCEPVSPCTKMVKSTVD